MIKTEAGLITEAARDGFRIRLKELEPLQGGADAFARTFKGVDESGQVFFVKTRTCLDPGIALCAALHDAGIKEVLAPLANVDGKPSQALPGGHLLIYPWIEGSNGFEHLPGPEQWRQVGKALRRVHDAELPVAVSEQLAKESFQVPGVQTFGALMERLLSGHVQSEFEQALATLIREHQEEIEDAIGREAMLGRFARETEWPFVPCHSDIHMANVLIDTSGDVHLIDWDAPRLAPRECDLMFFFAPGILGKHGAAEERAFFEGYGDPKIDPMLIDYYRIERKLGDIVSFAHEAASLESQTPEQRWEALRYFEMQFR